MQDTSELDELRLAYAECSRQRNELLTKLKHQAQQPVQEPVCRGCGMKLPDPDTHCWDEDTETEVWSYSKELVEQMLAQADKDFSDGMMVVHLQVVDQMRRKYEPVLKMALEALLTAANPKAPAAIKALEDALK